MIKKEIKTETRTRVVEQARYRDVETGEFEEVAVVDRATGSRRVEQRAIMQRVHVPAKFVEETVEKDVWRIERKGEVHEFMSEGDAQRFAATLNSGAVK